MLKSRQINTDQPTPLLPGLSDSLGCAHAVHVSITHQQDVENPENKHTPTHASVAESRRDQEEGGELDSHEEVKTLSRVQARSRRGRWCWTLKLAQKRSRAGRRSWAQEVGLLLLQLCFSSSCYGHCPRDICSAQQLKQQLRGTLVATQWRGDTALTFWLFWRRSTASAVFRIGARGRAFTLSPPPPATPTPPVPNGLPRFCGRKAKCLLLPLLPGRTH